MYLECNTGVKSFEGTVSGGWMIGGKEQGTVWNVADELYYWAVATGTEAHTTSSQDTQCPNCIEAGKLPNTIQKGCPLRHDDRFSFPVDRQSLHSRP